jgi:hypothetical protein
MKYSFDCYIRTNNDGIRNAVKQLIPDVNDSRVWGGEYVFAEGTDDEGTKVFNCQVRFNIESDRNSITASVKGLTGVINACEYGSFVREHRCFHDEIPPKPCEEETILRKT